MSRAIPLSSLLLGSYAPWRRISVRSLVTTVLSESVSDTETESPSNLPTLARKVVQISGQIVECAHNAVPLLSWCYLTRLNVAVSTDKSGGKVHRLQP